MKRVQREYGTVIFLALGFLLCAACLTAIRNATESRPGRSITRYFTGDHPTQLLPQTRSSHVLASASPLMEVLLSNEGESPLHAPTSLARQAPSDSLGNPAAPWATVSPLGLEAVIEDELTGSERYGDLPPEFVPSESIGSDRDLERHALLPQS